MPDPEPRIDPLPECSIPCPLCAQTGKVTRRGFERDCSRCGGEGWVAALTKAEEKEARS